MLKHSIFIFILFLYNSLAFSEVISVNKDLIFTTDNTISSDSLNFNVDTTQLPELTVTGKNATVIKNGMSYVPVPKQKKTSVNGYDLLAKMQVPQLLTPNGVNGSIFYINGGELSYYIDGVKASEMQVKSILPKDVISIEVLFSPEDPRFGGDRYVVNYVIKHYEFGGYTFLSADQDLTNYNGQYSVFNKIEYKRSTFSIYGGTKYRVHQKLRNKENALYHMIGKNGNQYDLTKESESLTDNKTTQFDAALLWDYLDNQKGLSLSVVAGVTGFYRPEVNIEGMSKYNLPGFGDVSFRQSLDDSQLTPSLSVSLNKQTSKGMWSAGYIFSSTIQNNHSEYLSDALTNPLYNAVKGNAYNNRLDVSYQHRFNTKNRLLTKVSIAPDVFDYKYSGTDNTEQRLINASETLGLTYYFSPERYNISVGGSVNVTSLKIGDTPIRTSVNPAANASYWLQTTDNQSLSLEASYRMNPLINSSLNTVSRIDNEFQGTKGNPDLSRPHSVNVSASYQWTFYNIFSMSFTPDWSHTFNSYKQVYESENDIMYSYLINSGSNDLLSMRLRGVSIFLIIL